MLTLLIMSFTCSLNLKSFDIVTHKCLCFVLTGMGVSPNVRFGMNFSLRYVKCCCIVLFVLNFIIHSSPYLYISLRSCWSVLCTFSLLLGTWFDKRQASSAKNNISFLVFVARSFKYIRANNGPKTDPCGHPAFIDCNEDFASLIITRCRLSLK